MDIINLYINIFYSISCLANTQQQQIIAKWKKIISAIISLNIAENCINVREVFE